jgi:uncharacterized protein
VYDSRGGSVRMGCYDEAHSDEEDRFIAIGPVEHGLIVVIWTERPNGSIRIISARWATRREQRLYQEYLR